MAGDKKKKKKKKGEVTADEFLRKHGAWRMGPPPGQPPTPAPTSISAPTDQGTISAPAPSAESAGPDPAGTYVWELINGLTFDVPSAVYGAYGAEVPEGYPRPDSVIDRMKQGMLFENEARARAREKNPKAASAADISSILLPLGAGRAVATMGAKALTKGPLRGLVRSGREMRVAEDAIEAAAAKRGAAEKAIEELTRRAARLNSIGGKGARKAIEKRIKPQVMMNKANKSAAMREIREAKEALRKASPPGRGLRFGKKLPSVWVSEAVDSLGGTAARAALKLDEMATVSGNTRIKKLINSFVDRSKGQYLTDATAKALWLAIARDPAVSREVEMLLNRGLKAEHKGYDTRTGKRISPDTDSDGEKKKALLERKKQIEQSLLFGRNPANKL